ncbi:MAG TPA: hypothetical protein VIM94_04225 [Salegentibacter sp.]
MAVEADPDELPLPVFIIIGEHKPVVIQQKIAGLPEAEPGGAGLH